MASFNKITIVGYLGRDPEIRYTPSGDAFCSFSVATTDRKKESSGDFKDETTWFRITTWRRQAEVANQYLRKGSQVYIEGKLRLNEYTDRDGNRRSSLEVTATDLQFIGSRGDDAMGGGGGSSAPAPRAAATPANRPASGGGASQHDDFDDPPVSDNEIPF